MGSMIDYIRPDGGAVKGYLAPGPAGAPGVVVIQEWWGLNDQIRGVADRYAAAGYGHGHRVGQTCGACSCVHTPVWPRTVPACAVVRESLPRCFHRVPEQHVCVQGHRSGGIPLDQELQAGLRLVEWCRQLLNSEASAHAASLTRTYRPTRCRTPASVSSRVHTVSIRWPWARSWKIRAGGS